jgi:hypothetical protein
MECAGKRVDVMGWISALTAQNVLLFQIGFSKQVQSGSALSTMFKQFIP